MTTTMKTRTVVDNGSWEYLAGFARDAWRTMDRYGAVADAYALAALVLAHEAGVCGKHADVSQLYRFRLPSCHLTQPEKTQAYNHVFMAVFAIDDPSPAERQRLRRLTAAAAYVLQHGGSAVCRMSPTGKLEVSRNLIDATASKQEWIVLDGTGGRSIAELRKLADAALVDCQRAARVPDGSSRDDGVSMSGAAAMLTRETLGRTPDEVSAETRRALQDLLISLVGMFGESETQAIYRRAEHG